VKLPKQLALQDGQYAWSIEQAHKSKGCVLHLRVRRIHTNR
jgi:hypothetical protein